MPKPKRHVWEEGSTYRAVTGAEYDKVWDYADELEAEIVELRELSQAKTGETAGEFVERRIQDIFQEVAEHVGNGLFELDHPAPIFRGSIRMTNAWKEYLDELDSE